MPSPASAPALIFHRGRWLPPARVRVVFWGRILVPGMTVAWLADRAAGLSRAPGFPTLLAGTGSRWSEGVRGGLDALPGGGDRLCPGPGGGDFRVLRRPPRTRRAAARKTRERKVFGSAVARSPSRASIPPMSGKLFQPFQRLQRLPSFPAPASAWPAFGGSSNATAGAPGPKAPWAAAPPSTSP